MLPNRLPGASPGGALGLNLLPRSQVSARSAAPGTASSLKPDPRRRNDGAPESESAVDVVRTGARDERQSEALSDIEEGGGPSRRREPSRDDWRSGRGPSRRQGPENLSSSNPPPPPKPERSFAAAPDEVNESAR